MPSKFLLPSPELVRQINDSKNKHGEAALLTCVISCTLVPIRSACPGFPFLRHFPCTHETSNLFNKLNAACRCQLCINHTQFRVSLALP